jgi:hypothetical protein
LRLIERAEQAKRRGDHNEMVARREELMGIDRDVFSAYMVRAG